MNDIREAVAFMEELIGLGAGYDEALHQTTASYELEYDIVEQAFWAAQTDDEYVNDDDYDYDDEEFA